MTSTLLLGAQTPTAWCAPPSVGNASGEVVDLMLMLGQPGDAWQGFTWQTWLGERRDGSWAAFECACFVQRQNGKGVLTDGRELGGLFLFGEKKIIHTAHRIDTAKEAFTRCSALVEGSDELTRRLKRINRVNGEEAIELMTGAVLQFRTRIRGSGRGLAGCECLVLDEALYLKPEHIDALGPTMLAAPNAQLVYTSTPPELPGAHIMGVLARMKAGTDSRLAGTAWFSKPGVDVDDPAVRAAVNPAYNRRITDERMADIRQLLGEEGFARECGGIWPREEADAWLVIGEGDWTDALAAWAAHSSPVAFALEYALDRSRAAVAVATRRSDGLRQVQLAALDPGTTWAVEWLVERVPKWRACATVVDPGGPAGSAIADLEAKGIEVMKCTTRQYAAACGALIDGIAGKVRPGEDAASVRDIRHTGQTQLDGAIAGLSLRTVGDVAVFERSGDGFMACAAALALWAHSVKAPDLDYDLMQSFG